MGRGWLFALLLGTILVLAPSSVAFAADPAHPPAADGDIFGKALDLGIWTIVVFLVLLFVLSKFAWKPMLEGLRKREELIRSAVDEAKKAREETERVRAEFKAEMAKAFEKIPLIMEEARRDAQQMSEEMRSKAQTEIQADRQRLRREIETARDQALQDIWTQSAQLATLISAKAIGRSISSDDHRRLVDEALADLKQAGDERQREVAGMRA